MTDLTTLRVIVEPRKREENQLVLAITEGYDSLGPEPKRHKPGKLSKEELFERVNHGETIPQEIEQFEHAVKTDATIVAEVADDTLEFVTDKVMNDPGIVSRPNQYIAHLLRTNKKQKMNKQD